MNARLTAVSWLDWKLGARMLLKHPGLTLIGGLSLAAAITIGVVGIEVAGELLYKRLPFDEGGRVVRLETQDVAASRAEPRVLHDFALWRRSLKTVMELGAARLSERNVLTGEGRVEALRVAEITASAFPLTRVPPLLGRTLQPADETPSADPVVVLAYDVWQRQFLHDPSIIGRVVTIGRTARTVVGVMPPRFGFPRNQQIWVPLLVQDAPPREGPAVQVFGRLADGASWQDAKAEIEVLSARAAADRPATHAQLRTRVRAFAGRTPGDPLQLADWLIHVIVLLVLAAVSVNVATLIFARTAMREPEMVVRHALGASRARVVAQIVIESFVLTLSASLLGLVVAQLIVSSAWARAGEVMDGLPFWVDLALEPATIAYAFLLALIAAPMIGLLPALKATGASIQRGLQGITGTGGTMKFGGVWSFIIGAQVAFALLFLPAAAGIASTAMGEDAAWAEFPAERYLTFALSTDNEALAGEKGVPDDDQIAARRARAYEEVARRLREEPGVSHVTYGDHLPTMSPDWVTVEMEQDGVPAARLQGNYEGGFGMAAVGEGYHDAFGIKIVAGRALHAADADAPNRPVVVNEAFMRVVGKNPVGARVRTLQRGGQREVGPWLEIVGVVSDFEMPFPADWGGAASIYRAASAADVDPVMVAVRVAGDAAPLGPRVASLAREVDAGLRLRDVISLETVVAAEHKRMVGTSLVFGSVLLVAVIFSAASLYALMAVAVQRRTREIGIRVALGASRQRVLRTVFARAGRQLGGGIIAGNTIVLLVAWRTESMTTALVVALMIMSVVLTAVGALACAAPARRALRVQPTEALRQG
jgi:putative ABC transport system permease protein